MSAAEFLRTYFSCLHSSHIVWFKPNSTASKPNTFRMYTNHPSAKCQQDKRPCLKHSYRALLTKLNGLVFFCLWTHKGWFNSSANLKTKIQPNTDTDFKDSLCTNPSIVQVSVQETTAQSGDPGKNCPPLNVVSNSPEREKRERERREIN